MTSTLGADQEVRAEIGGRTIKHAKRLARILLGIIVFLLIWQYLHTYVVHPRLLPSPWQVAVTTYELFASGEMIQHIAISMKRILVGYVWGCLIGIALGVIIGRSVFMRDVISPFLELLRPLSPVALVPLVLIWFGIDEAAKYFLVGYTAAIIVLFATAFGVASTPVIRERAATSLGASRLQVFLHVIIPSAIPHIVNGMRTALGFAYMAIVAAEMIAADAGLGYLIMQSRLLIQVDQTFAGLITLSILGALTDVGFRATVLRMSKRYQYDLLST